MEPMRISLKGDKGFGRRDSQVEGYGFIEQDNGKDVFVHYSSVDMPGFKTLIEGERVNFEMEEGDRGPVAKNVKRS